MDQCSKVYGLIHSTCYHHRNMWVSPKCFHRIHSITKNILNKKSIRTWSTLWERERAGFTTETERHLYQRGSSNWPQFMLQWFVRFPEFAQFTEFPLQSGKPHYTFHNQSWVVSKNSAFSGWIQDVLLSNTDCSVWFLRRKGFGFNFRSVFPLINYSLPISLLNWRKTIIDFSLKWFLEKFPVLIYFKTNVFAHCTDY